MAGWGANGTNDYVPEALLFTDRYFRPKFVDQLYNSNATLYMLRKGAKLISGGTSIEVPSLVANTGNFAWHTKAETYTATDVDQFDAARFEWKLAVQPVVIFEQDLLMNGDSKERRLSHVAARNMAAALEMGDNFGTALFDLDHTADSAIDRIDHAVSDASDNYSTNTTANTTYGGITRAATGVQALWNATVDDTTATTSLGAIQTAYGNATEGSEHPNLGVTTQTGFNRLWVMYSPFQRIGTDLDGKLGFQSLNVNGQPVIVDSHCPENGGTNDTGDTGVSYFYWLNLNHLYMVAHKQAFFTFRASPMPVNQWVNIGHYHWMGNVVCDAPRYQSKLTALAA